MIRQLIALLGLLLVLSSCGNSSSATTSTTLPAAPLKTATPLSTYKPIADACTLASATEIAGIVSVSVQPQSNTEQGLATCTYAATTQSYAQTNVNVEPTIDSAQTDFTNQQEGIDVVGVSGIGDGAFFDGDETLTVLTKNALISVVLHIDGSQQKLAQDKQIASLILPRLT